MPAALRWLLRLVPLNPIAVRLVQGGSRRSRHNLIRSAYLFTLGVVLLLLLLPAVQGAVAFQTLARNGASAFEIVAYLQVGLICILSPVFMAGAIAQESNPRTWEVMLTTPLNSLQMVLGHLFGRLFFVIALLLASLPMFAITQYFGGVPGRTILLSYLVAGGAALLVGAIAVALAVSRLAGRRAVFTFYVAVVTYIAATFAVDRAITTGGVTHMTALNPFLALRSLVDPSGYPRPDPIALSQMGSLERLWLGDPVLAWVLVCALSSLLLVVASTFTVRSVGGKTSGGRVFRRGSGGERIRAPRPVGTNPIAWREATARQATFAKTALRWLFIGSGLAWGLGLVWMYHRTTLSHQEFQLALLYTVWTELIVIALIAINLSATAISREREDGTLDLLLTTPITPKEYLGGKLKGLISYLSPLIAVPLGTLAFASLYVLAGGFGRTGGVEVQTTFNFNQSAVPVILPEIALTMPLVVLSFMAFCVMVGLNWSMKSKGTIGSVVMTVGAVGVIAGIVGLCGWQAGRSVPILGPVLSASTPITALLGGVTPDQAFGGGAVSNARGFSDARVALGAGAVLSAIVYGLIVLGIRSSMVRTFDMAVRKLAGTGS